MMSVNKNRDRAIVFNYLVTNRFDFIYTTLPVKLKGLDPEKKYRLKELNVYPGTRSFVDSETVYSGEFLMNVGFNPTMSQRRTSVIVEVVEVE
ncbi:MAG: GH36 C-terminal domain-containing protein, partial [Bacteroidia bacterium]